MLAALDNQAQQDGFNLFIVEISGYHEVVIRNVYQLLSANAA